MNLPGTGMNFFGRKTEPNLLNTVKLLPEKPIDVVVDCCFGSGNFSRLIGTQCNLTEYLTKRTFEREIRCEVTGNDGKHRKIKSFRELTRSFEVRL